MENKIHKYKLVKDIPYYNKGLISKYDILSDMHYFQNTKIEDSFSKSFRTWKFFEHEADYLLEMGWIEEVISAKDKLLNYVRKDEYSSIYSYICNDTRCNRIYSLLNVGSFGDAKFLCVEEIDGDFIGWFWYANLITTDDTCNQYWKDSDVFYVEEYEETVTKYRKKL